MLFTRMVTLNTMPLDFRIWKASKLEVLMEAFETFERNQEISESLEASEQYQRIRRSFQVEREKVTKGKLLEPVEPNGEP